MPKRTTSLKVLVPLAVLLGQALLAELALWIAVRPPPPWTPEKQMALVTEGERRYPPSTPLFASRDEQRPRLRHRNFPLLGAELRDYPVPLAKAERTTRIVGLGDSFAWGWGVLDNRRTFFKLLEHWLRTSDPGRPVEVLNAAQPGAPASYYPEFLDSLGFRLDPDLVVVSFNLNDAYVKHASITVDAKTARQLEQTMGFWSRHSRLVRFVRERLLRARIRRDFIANIHEAYLGSEKAQRWARAQEDLRRVATGCRKRGIALLVVVFPLLVDLDRDYPFTAEVETIVDFCRQNGIRCLSLLPTFLGKKPELLWTHPTNAHPNEVAHRLAAEAIYPVLLRDRLIPVR